MAAAPQYVIRGFNIDGATDRYFGGHDASGCSMWVPLSQAKLYRSKVQARHHASYFGVYILRKWVSHAEVERLSVTQGSVPCHGGIR